MGSNGLVAFDVEKLSTDADSETNRIPGTVSQALRVSGT